MKTIKSRVFTVIVCMLVAVALFALVACENHTHDYTKYEKNDTQHWKVCPEDGEEEAGSRVNHSYTLENNTKCVCGAVKPADGGEHTHSYTEWGKSDTEHWKYCPDDNAD